MASGEDSILVHINKRIYFCCFIGLALNGHVGAVTVGHLETFAGDEAGWKGSFTDGPMVVDDGGPGGNGDRFLMVSSVGGNGPGSRLATFNQAADWIGNYTAANLGSIQVDMMSPTTSQELAMRLVLFGKDGQTTRWTSSQPARVPNDGVWRSYTFPVGVDDLVLADGSDDYETTLSDVGRVMFRHATDVEAGGTRIRAEVGLDNLRIHAVPEPSALGLALIGFLPILRARHLSPGRLDAPSALTSSV